MAKSKRHLQAGGEIQSMGSTAAELGDAFIKRLIEDGMDYSSASHHFRLLMFKHALIAAKHNKCEAARRLKVHRNTFPRIVKPGDPVDSQS